METRAQLEAIIANYWQLSPEAIDWDLELNGRRLKNFSSLRLLRFLASVEEQCHVTVEDPDAVKRFCDVLNLVERSAC